MDSNFVQHLNDLSKGDKSAEDVQRQQLSSNPVRFFYFILFLFVSLY